MEASHERYHLGIDLGSTCTTAAVCRGGRPEPVTLGASGISIPTVALRTADGELLVGEAAQRRAATEPHRVARGFTQRIGDDIPLVLGDEVVPAADIAARFVGSVVELVTAREGAAPASIALTHPVGWGAHRRATLLSALATRGIVDLHLVAEPVAAALGHGASTGTVAVYDLGGDSCTASVLSCTDGTPALVGEPVRLPGIGGRGFDEHVLDHVRDALGTAWDALDAADPSVLAAVAALRRDCAEAKQALSADVDATVTVMLPELHTRVRIGRADFEDRIRPDVAATVAALQQALSTSPDTVLLVGGSARIPLVPQMVSAGLGRPVTVDADPCTTAARGAAISAHRRATVVAAPAALQPPDRPAVPTLRSAAPVWPPARRRSARFRGVLVAAVATTGIALAAAATAYTLDPTLLSGEVPAALVEPAPAAPAVVPEVAPPADPPAAAPEPVHAAAPVRRAVVAPRVGGAPKPAARTVAPTTAAAPTSAPPSVASPAPTVAPPADPPNAGGSGNEPPPPAGGGGPTVAPPPPADPGPSSGPSAPAQPAGLPVDHGQNAVS
ncbi:Hsp70 family protein [Pseudonocardia sp. CA-107938]|uniref:Hsp70 family protein n=1 Tax=Pseudonocardia sp. CA-107938 TaxID=3240021 RepID=UPI003D8A3FE7